MSSCLWGRQALKLTKSVLIFFGAQVSLFEHQASNCDSKKANLIIHELKTKKHLSLYHFTLNA